MALILIFVITFLGTLLGKFLFKKWINHLTLYSFFFGISIFLYELKLLPYIDIIPFAWFIVILSSLSFLLGIVTVISARNLSRENPIVLQKLDISLKIFSDDGKTLKFAIIFFSLISIYSTIEFWMFLIKQFGSIPGVLINSQVIYRLNISGDLVGFTPYISLSGFIALFFAAIYTAYKRKFSILSFIPLISIMIREIGQAGRAAMSVALVEFVLTFILFRYLLKSDFHQRFNFSRANAIVASVLLVVLFILAVSIVRISRTTESSEKFTGASSELSQTKENILISPTIYLYASSNIAVLSKYFSSEGENTGFGQNTFQTIHYYLSRLELIDKLNERPKGYYIPTWTNSATYLRDLHADFGISGVLLGPFFLGLLLTWLWFKFYEKQSIIAFTFLIYFNLIVVFACLGIVTRFTFWSLALLFILLFIPVLEKISTLVSQKTP
jgi:oligosaccharide repeat unit polymerase